MDVNAECTLTGCKEKVSLRWRPAHCVGEWCAYVVCALVSTRPKQTRYNDCDLFYLAIATLSPVSLILLPQPEWSRSVMSEKHYYSRKT